MKPLLTQLIVQETEAEQRLDNFLFKHCKRIPKSLFYRKLRTGQIRLNGKKTSQVQRVMPGDIVSLPAFQEGSGLKLVQKGGPGQLFDTRWIVAEDEYLILINKPSGLAVHGGSGIALGLIERLRASRPQAAGLELVHRLDKGTSGLLLVAKKRSALRALQAQLTEKTITKTYLAVVHGHWPDKLTTVNYALEKKQLSTGGRFVKVTHQSTGKYAETQFKVLKRFGCKATLIEAKPITGRTHQIRVHTAAVGHAIVGDDRYGEKVSIAGEQSVTKPSRLYLHAYQLRFKHPESQQVVSTTTVPDATWDDYLAQL